MGLDLLAAAESIRNDDGLVRQLAHPRQEQTLADRLAKVERLPGHPERSGHSATPLRRTFDRQAEPVEELLLRDAAGVPCVETKTTLDLEHALNMPGGNIFHGSLEWPFLEDGAARATPAQRWGVDTGHERILICGAGARRGGGVSGLGGHNAAMAVLDELGTV